MPHVQCARGAGVIGTRHISGARRLAATAPVRSPRGVACGARGVVIASLWPSRRPATENDFRSAIRDAREIMTHAVQGVQRESRPELEDALLGGLAFERSSSSPSLEELTVRGAADPAASVTVGREPPSFPSPTTTRRKNGILPGFQAPTHGMPTLYRDCEDSFTLHVERLQSLLEERGFFPGDDDLRDSRYGPGTEEAVMCFQVEENLPETGVMCGVTWDRLLNNREARGDARGDEARSSSSGRDRGVGHVRDARRRLKLISLEGFWIEQGLKGREASRLAERLVSTLGDDVDANLLMTKLGRLGRILPGVDVARAVYSDERLLFVDVSALVARMTRLLALLPGARVAEIVAEAPDLLLCNALEEKVASSLARLQALSADGMSQGQVNALVEQHPEILLRLGAYDVRSPHDVCLLPLDIQNALSVGGAALNQVTSVPGSRRTRD